MDQSQKVATTKKNRLASDHKNTSVVEEGDEDELPKEGQTVGEVRRKVEKMTYEEERDGVVPHNGEAIQQEEQEEKEDDEEDEEDEEDGAREDEANGATMDDPPDPPPEGSNQDAGDDSGGEWENIDASEVLSKVEPTPVVGKRKALDRSASSLVPSEDELSKRPKETPSVSHLRISSKSKLIQKSAHTRDPSAQETSSFILSILLDRFPFLCTTRIRIHSRHTYFLDLGIRLCSQARILRIRIR